MDNTNDSKWLQTGMVAKLAIISGLIIGALVGVYLAVRWLLTNVEIGTLIYWLYVIIVITVVYAWMKPHIIRANNNDGPRVALHEVWYMLVTMVMLAFIIPGFIVLCSTTTVGLARMFAGQQ
jgi:hypothetical protein